MCGYGHVVHTETVFSLVPEAIREYVLNNAVHLVHEPSSTENRIHVKVSGECAPNLKSPTYIIALAYPEAYRASDSS